MLGGESLAKDVELVRVADRTEGYTGSDLREVCTAAAMRPLRDLLKATGKSARLQASTESCRASLGSNCRLLCGC